MAEFAPAKQEPNIPFNELVYTMAESIASAQAKLDLQTAEMLEVLAETDVDVVPQITREINEEGNITSQTEPAEKRSLLELGFSPTRYQFSEATIDVEFNLSITEQDSRESESEYELWAGTYEIQEERKYQRDVEGTAKMSATLEPVPVPVQLSPSESIETENGPTEREEN